MSNPLQRMATIERRLDKGEEAPPPTLYCSFCGKSQYEVRKLIAGHGGAFICDECVLVCVGVLVAAPAPNKEAV